MVSILAETKKLRPSVEKAPKMELKPLPVYLKYVFLGKNETLPIINSSSPEPGLEHKLISVLRKCKTTIGWTIIEIQGISLALCMQEILLEDNTIDVRDR